LERKCTNCDASQLYTDHNTACFAQVIIYKGEKEKEIEIPKNNGKVNWVDNFFKGNDNEK